MASPSAVLLLLLLAAGGQGAVVHVIPHSHCDPGYVQSFSDYYEKEVKKILDSVVAALEKNATRRFIWEEVSFLARWWRDASSQQKQLVERLAGEGRLEFTGGGWVMHDEAVTSVFGILNQMFVGADFMRGALDGGDCARNEWHIDPFGHSSFTPLLYSQLGYQSVVLNRIPNPIKQQFKKTKSLEFIWKNPYSNETIFTHVLDSHYSLHFADFHGSTLDEKASSFVALATTRLQWFKHDHLLLPFGSDFAFTDAESDFSQLDSLISHINANKTRFNTTVRYSTLAEYSAAVVKYPGVVYPTLDRDFFPYIPCYKCGDQDCSLSPCESQSSGYWSGFFTSKPGQKLLVRKQEASLNALEALNSFHALSESQDVLKLARNTSALLQHHDAITGTSYPAAFNDYTSRLGRALKTADLVIARLKATVTCGGDATTPNFTSNSSLLAGLHGNKTAAVLIQNPLASQRSLYINIDLPGDMCVKAHDAVNRLLGYQQVGSRLYVSVQLPAWGVGVVFLSNTSCSGMERKQTKATNGFTLTNGVTSLLFNATNHLAAWNSSRLSSAHPLRHRYVSYKEAEGTNVYVLRVVEEDNLTPGFLPTIVTASGPLVFEAKQQVNEFINTTLRLYRPPPLAGSLYDSFVEWQTTVGPLPTQVSLTVASQFLTDFKTNNFTTYTSGYFPVGRSYNGGLPIQGSVYPLVGRLHVNSTNSNVTVAMVTERPVGVTVFNSSLTTMIHRRSPGDGGRDDYGTVMTDPIYLGLMPQGRAVSMATAQLMQEVQTPVTVHFALLNSTSDWTRLCRSGEGWSPRNNGTLLPPGVRVIAVKRLGNSSSTAVGLNVINADQWTSHSFDISTLFPEGGVASVYETTPTFRTVRRLDSNVVTMDTLAMRSFRVQLKSLKSENESYK